MFSMKYLDSKQLWIALNMCKLLLNSKLSNDHKCIHSLNCNNSYRPSSKLDYDSKVACVMCSFMKEACCVWERILLHHPTDMLALKLAHDCYFYLGYQPLIRDSIARVIPEWKSSTPLYGYLFGMHAFGLCETGRYDESEKAALKVAKMCYFKNVVKCLTPGLPSHLLDNSDV